MHADEVILYYIHDPMCSWCWGFRRSWDLIQKQLPAHIKIKWVLGGLAPDSSELMPLDLQNKIKGHWQRIQKLIPGVEFNYHFWTQCQPRRSTYPACRGVLAAKKQDAAFMLAMNDSIQKAYYLHAKNPSDDHVLIELAKELGLDEKQFSIDLQSSSVEKQLRNEIKLYHDLASLAGISGFPSLVLKIKGNVLAVPIDYTDPALTLTFIRQHH